MTTDHSNPTEPGDLPPGSYLPHSRNPLFTGREDELLSLAIHLLPGSASHSVAITATGIGGIGKTQLAVEFAYRYGYHFAGGVYWVSFAEATSIVSNVARCGVTMGLYPENSDLTIQQQARLVQRAWNDDPTPRLLIFDNCESELELASWKPESGGGRVLVTARRQQWDPELGLTPLRLNVLDEAESIALLRRYLGKDRRARDEDGLQGIADALGRLPLALRLAGSYLARYGRVSLVEYREALQRPDLLDHPSLQGIWQGTSATAHEQHVGRTFALSFDRLQPEQSDTDRLAVALLARAACFAPGEPLPLDLLLATVAAPEDNTLLPDDALARLLELGLLEPSGEANEAVRLHRLLVAFARPAAADEAAQSDVEQAVQEKVRRENQAGYPAAIRAWDIHLRHVVDHALQRADEQTAGLCNSMGYYLNMSGDLAGARPYYEQALAIWERVLGRDHPDTALSLNNLGYLLQAQGDLAGARPYYEQALAIRERVLGRDHPDTAQSLNNLGYLLQDLGDLAGARPYYEQALAIHERVLGGDHPDTALSLNNLGALLRAQGDLAGARPYYEQALAIRERVLGGDHPATARSLNNLGYLLQAQGDLAGARPYYEQALAIWERVLGPEHPDVAYSLNNLGLLLAEEGDGATAKAYLQRAVAILETKLGPDHPNTHTVRANLEGL